MLRLSLFALLTWLLRYGTCALTFINPPPFGAVRDYSGNPIYTIGEEVNVAWTEPPEGTGVSIVLYQLNKTDALWFGDMEYLTQNTIGSQRYSWLVGTRKNLTESDLFFLSIFLEGEGTSDSNSHYFFIRSQEKETPTPSATSSISRPSATERSTSPASSPTETPSASAQPPPPSSPSGSSSGLGTAAIAGITVSIVAALAMGFGIGFLLFRRRNRREVPPPMSPNPFVHPAELANWTSPIAMADSTTKLGHWNAPAELGDSQPFKSGARH